jgi:hypothetical protein
MGAMFLPRAQRAPNAVSTQTQISREEEYHSRTTREHFFLGFYVEEVSVLVPYGKFIEK